MTLPPEPQENLIRKVAPSMRSVARLPRGQRAALVKGQDSGRFMDFYHNILTASWPWFFAQLAAAFVVVNLCFACLYVLDRGGIANARPGSFADAFFFSVQTLGTLGYGVMAPKTLWANLLVTVESFSGILTIALFTGIIFARFSRPFARVVFSNVAVVAPFDGVPTLMFRTANQRGEAIMDASITVTLARQHTTMEGVTMRRFQELKLMRSSNSLFALSWTVMHPIDADSPLYGLTGQDMQDQDMEIVVMLNGLDEILADRIYARHAYWADEIAWNQRFVDVISVTADGHRLVDLTRFHDTNDC
ncbi:MAG: channel inward rectifier conserved region 2 domain protein [Alphaproteobacteria bacterium]|jgi:inward rectifier potassium channel|nr:channel inward rectifier conserved region 2 domain protein [Alphaproteobacteria bacterium]